MIRRAPLPLQQQVFCPIQRGGRTAAGRERGQAYNLIAEEAETSEEVIAGKIMVHSKHVLTLFDSSASHCYISYSFTTLHSTPIVCSNNQ